MIFIRRCPTEKIAFFDTDGLYHEITLVSLNEETGNIHLALDQGTPVPIEYGGVYEIPHLEVKIHFTGFHFFDLWPTAAGLQISAAPHIVVKRQELIRELTPDQLIQVARDTLQKIEFKREQKKLAQLSGNV